MDQYYVGLLSSDEIKFDIIRQIDSMQCQERRSKNVNKNQTKTNIYTNAIMDEIDAQKNKKIILCGKLHLRTQELLQMAIRLRIISTKRCVKR